jgi:hypothetical protein
MSYRASLFGMFEPVSVVCVMPLWSPAALTRYLARER